MICFQFPWFITPFLSLSFWHFFVQPLHIVPSSSMLPLKHSKNQNDDVAKETMIWYFTYIHSQTVICWAIYFIILFPFCSICCCFWRLFCFCSFLFFEPISENAKRHAEYKGRQKTKCKQAAKATATTTVTETTTIEATTKIERIAGALEATAAKRIFHNFLRDKVAFAGIK